MKKTVHIISHSHWDREWYMAYEQHHMRLVDLFEDLFDVFENDPGFKSYHLDGQTISIDDYLEVCPENKDKVKRLVEEKKLFIGPFYILQDDFLISAEANARNMLVGIDESKRWGEPVKLGYFPDTFGNMGQAPQMMKQGGLDAVAFGRGVKTTGFNNVVVDEDYASKYSEINWEGADGTEILSILFANWYSNGNEIPVEPEAAKIFWDQKLADVERYASTPHLLMMNGVDHQPIQKDVAQAIALANEMYPEYTFIHSNFPDYIKAVQETLPEDIGSVKGELTSQETDGWYTLANTSSSRIYLKQENTNVQNLLERVTEPLATMATTVTNDYPHDKLRYAWKKLMQNHPHDSICGCSVDSVHRGMMTRFEDAKQVGEFVRDEALRHLQSNIDTKQFPDGAKPFVVFNTEGLKKKGIVETEIEWERIPFNHRKPNENYDILAAKEYPELEIRDVNGNTIAFEIVSTDVKFGYDLPKDAFRKPYFIRTVTVRLSVEMDAFSWQTFALLEGVSMPSQEKTSAIENSALHIEITDMGSINIHDKVHNKTYGDVLYFDDAGDMGNEYIFKQTDDHELITSKGIPAEIEYLEMSDLVKKVRITQIMSIPKSAEETLQLEQKSVTEMRERKSRRSKEMVDMKIETTLTLEHESSIIKFETQFNNQAKDHRVRAIFNSGMKTETHESESIFEVVTRPNSVSKSWENPSNPQHQQAFTAITNDNQGMVVGNIGLNEYEVINGSAIALTIHRGVGEMGDWGYFPTPEAQCLGMISVNYALSFHGENDKYEHYRNMKAMQVPFITTQTSVKSGKLPANYQFLFVDAPNAYITSMKRKEYQKDIMVRMFNLDNEAASGIKLEFDNKPIYDSDLLESVRDHQYESKLKAGEIRTVRIPDEK
ncbi:alpha-mannosidase [Erysipelothrix inopinata]|uniref:Alpha-mannosidase n=1 Tax=Erysipelothrix inopinata TaxID=225084 RepID=A0A7G9RZI5_9FIRM|nr:alpha-mannosidase [Erysipelothrix inopinata]QNN61010.1 alpha-mannosidase [Erysipelothrix inopinata]